MKLIIIAGPHAVGKMTVGQELTKITDLKLFHNHMTIDVVSDLFDNIPDERRRLTGLFREEIFNAFSRSDEYGIIFTYMWAFDDKNDWNYIEQVEEIFKKVGAEIYYVELEADFDVRIERNKTENRLLNKSTKRDIEKSENCFRRLEQKYRLNTIDGEFGKGNYIKIDNTDLNPEDVARIIKERFNL